MQLCINGCVLHNLAKTALSTVWCVNQVINAPPGVPIKLCRRCNQHKPLTDFYRSKANADGYDGRCKACDAIQCAERRRKKARVEVWSAFPRHCCDSAREQHLHL